MNPINGSAGRAAVFSEEHMITLTKAASAPFTVLNLTDVQLGDDDWKENRHNSDAAMRIVRDLVDRVRPDLITLSGDQAYSGCDSSYEAFADFLDSLCIPWAPVWGNHDNQGGPEYVDALADRMMAHPFCRYEKGDPALGNGNYVIRIEEDGAPVSAILMMDSHDRTPYGEAGNMAWGKFTPEQIRWFLEQTRLLEAAGCQDCTVLTHIPIYAYREAAKAAFAPGIDPKSIHPEDSTRPELWNPGYRDSCGVQYEMICSYPEDEGFLDAMLESRIAKRMICGHQHINNWMITYRGIRLIFALKTGPGSYRDPRLNGGTVLRITKEGCSVSHVFSAICPEQ